MTGSFVIVKLFFLNLAFIRLKRTVYSKFVQFGESNAEHSCEQTSEQKK